MESALQVKKAESVTLAPLPGLLGQAANQAAGRAAFAEYVARKSTNTLRRQSADLVAFAEFLEGLGETIGDLGADPDAWRAVTWGFVSAWQKYLLKEGYAVTSVNQKLSTIKTYAGLAVAAGALEAGELAKIKLVRSYSHREALRMDEKRLAAETPTRKSTKKSEAVSISMEQAQALKAQPDTPQGRRDALLMCLLLDHGLRCGEVVILRVEHVDLKKAQLRFYRPKVDRQQAHRLTEDTLVALKRYMALDQLAESGSLLLGSKRNGALAGTFAERAICARVAALGAEIGLIGLSPHDCRHYWATLAARSGTHMERLKDAGGWSSLAMPSRYIEAAAIANQGVLLTGG